MPLWMNVKMPVKESNADEDHDVVDSCSNALTAA